MITTWLFEFFHALHDPAAHADPAQVQAHFDHYIELWSRAEAQGYDGIFFSEHHFGAGYSPSPNLLVAHLAARTRTLRLGVLGTVTPYATPWRVVEEFAMLDHLTHGRFERGVVSGIPPELSVAGIGPDEAARRHRDIADAVDAARHGVRLSLDGPEWCYDGLDPHPPPLQRAAAVWTAARSAESARRAAARGWRLAAGFDSTERIAAMFDAYRDTAAAAGHPHDATQLGLRRMVLFVDDPGLRRAGVHAGKRALLDLLQRSAGPLPPFAALLDRPNEESDVLSDDEFVAGTPDQVAEELVRQCRAIGAGHLLVKFAATEPAALDVAQRTFAEHVLPILHST